MGISASAPAQPEEYECSDCGAVVSVSDKVCPKCGANLDEIEEETSIALTPAPVVTESLMTPMPTLPLIEGKKFSVRAVAYVIDVIALNVLNYVAALTAGFILGIVLEIIAMINGRRFVLNQQVLRGLDCVQGIIASIAYFSVFEWLFSATPGKLIFGMRVVMLDGNPCTFRAALVRALWRLIDGLIFGLIAYSSMKRSPLRQRNGDKHAGTVVVGSDQIIFQQPR